MSLGRGKGPGVFSAVQKTPDPNGGDLRSKPCDAKRLQGQLWSAFHPLLCAAPWKYCREPLELDYEAPRHARRKSLGRLCLLLKSLPFTPDPFLPSGPTTPALDCTTMSRCSWEAP